MAHNTLISFVYRYTAHYPNAARVCMNLYDIVRASERIMISTWKGFYHTSRWRKKIIPSLTPPIPSKSANALVVSTLWNMRYFCK